MKRKLLAAALAVLCLSVAVYGTVAYFTAEDTATNVITAGNVKIALNEAAITEDGETVAFEDVTGVVPGAEISKIVTVDNTGDNAAYVRIKVVKEITSENEPEGEFDPSLIGLDLDVENWTEKDGYYYYNTPLEAGETTAPLFTTVTFSKDMGNLYADALTTIQVHAEAVQVENNGSDVMSADGWPAD